MQGLQGALTRGRAAAESRMTSRCTIRRKTDNTVTVDNLEVPEWEVVHTNLPCRIASSQGATKSRTQSPGGVEVERSTPRLDLPASTADLRDGDLAEITSGENTGRVVRLREADWQDQATARRIPVEATERPEEWT
ncbi:DUF6093 family protein [Nocardioides sp. NPDC101246]|uniref:DUF6093 family protein n=1 Tax=Nocardioides sp. NPDC101246 TaxID=3364336 RepID=UPI003810A255